jgi:hypothetical protein
LGADPQAAELLLDRLAVGEMRRQAEHGQLAFGALHGGTSGVAEPTGPAREKRLRQGGFHGVVSGGKSSCSRFLVELVHHDQSKLAGEVLALRGRR